MSSRSEVLIRILALLQRKTFIETKNCTLKFLKMALFDCAINEKSLQCWRRTGHLPSFFAPTPGDSTAQESRPPAPGIRHPRQKNANPRGSAGGGGELGAGGVDWCITFFQMSIKTWKQTSKTWRFKVFAVFPVHTKDKVAEIFVQFLGFDVFRVSVLVFFSQKFIEYLHISRRLSSCIFVLLLDNIVDNWLF